MNIASSYTNEVSATAHKRENPIIQIFSHRKRILKIISIGLAQYKYNLIQSDYSQEAFIKADQYVPDIIIIDITIDNIRDILIINRFVSSERTAKTSILVIVPEHLKIKLEALVASKDHASQNLLKKRVHILMFPFEFSKLLQKIQQILVGETIDNSQTTHDAKQTQALLQSGGILFDPAVAKDKKFKSIASMMQKQWAFPFTIVKALDIMASQKSSTQELAHCIETDLAASAALLKMANTVFFTKRDGRVNNVLDAIIRLGFNETRALLSCFALIDLSSHIQTKSGFTRIEFWLHSLATGIISQKLFDDAGYKKSELAFVSGLLHDLGKIPLDNNFRDVFPKILEDTTTRIGPFHESEMNLLNFTHADLAHYFLCQWNFPPIIASAILNHHSIERISKVTPSADKILHTATFIANQLSKALQLGHSCDEVLQEIPLEFLQDFHHETGFSKEFFKDVFDRLQYFSALLGLPEKKFFQRIKEYVNPEGSILFIHGHHAMFHPLILALEYHGYQSKSVSHLESSVTNQPTVIISMPEPGRPLDIVVDDNEDTNNPGLRIFINDIEPLNSSAKDIDYNSNMIFINQNHLDTRLLLHLLDRFFVKE